MESSRRSPASLLLAALRLGGLVLLLAGCERGCARSWLDEHGVNQERAPKGTAPLNAMDCPDGLARCSGGIVETSLLATIPLPCRGTPEQCACPWERAGECGGDCAAEGAEIVVPAARARAQLCAPALDAGSFAIPPLDAGPAGCDEGQLYRCAGAVVTDCRENAVVARCLRGCVAEGTGVDDETPVTRATATAILCVR